MMQIENRDRLAIKSGIIFLLLAHLYRWTNAMFNHDSLMVYQIDWGWQISLGRIWVPLYAYLRGRIVSPVLCAACGSIFLLAAMIIIVRLLDLHRHSSVILLCGLLATHETLAFLNASFLFVYDPDMLALLFCVLAAYFTQAEKIRFHWLASIICMAAGLGLYQSYIEVTLVLIQILILKRLIEGEKTGSLWAYGLRCIGAVIAGALLYLLCLAVTVNITESQLSNDYNSLLQMKSLVSTDLISLLWKTWMQAFSYLLSPEAIHRTISAFLNACLGLAAAGLLVSHALKEKWGRAQYLLALFLMIVLPLSMNVSYLLSGGLKHGLMTYSYVLYFVMIIMIMDHTGSVSGGTVKKVKTGMSLTLSVLIFNHISFSNALYVKKGLEYDATLSLMTRLVTQMESTEGYEVGKTPVVILGVMGESPLYRERPGFRFVNDTWAGDAHHFGISYYETYTSEFTYILGYPINLLPEENTKKYMSMDEVIQMPVFPYEGSVKIVEDTLVIKLSEDMRTEKQRY